MLYNQKMSNPFEAFKDSLLFAQIEDFHDGIISAYEEAGIEHGALKVTKVHISPKGRHLYTRSKASVNQAAEQFIYFLHSDIMIDDIDANLYKILFLDENIIGEIYLSFITSKIYDVDYNTGVEVGKGVVDAHNFVKEGIGKEILDSIILFLIKRINNKKKITVQVSKFNTHSVRGYSIRAIIDRLSVYIEIDDVNDLEYINMVFTGVIDRKIELSPTLLQNMREGRIE